MSSVTKLKFRIFPFSSEKSPNGPLNNEERKAPEVDVNSWAMGIVNHMNRGVQVIKLYLIKKYLPSAVGYRTMMRWPSFLFTCFTDLIWGDINWVFKLVCDYWSPTQESCTPNTHAFQHSSSGLYRSRPLFSTNQISSSSHVTGSVAQSRPEQLQVSKARREIENFTRPTPKLGHVYKSHGFNPHM